VPWRSKQAGNAFNRSRMVECEAERLLEVRVRDRQTESNPKDGLPRQKFAGTTLDALK
jgi:hypothetical protein